jgi:hypothetical protein
LLSNIFVINAPIFKEQLYYYCERFCDCQQENCICQHLDGSQFGDGLSFCQAAAAAVEETIGKDRAKYYKAFWAH